MHREPGASYPPVEPYDHGLLDVGDGNLVHWEVCGNPEGKPALVVHGGPGSGCKPWARQRFDPELYRVVLFDQRGCGRSLPHAADPATGLRHNTTAHLIADMERLRVRLGIEAWLLFGWSWGATLSLAYAEAHPERVTEIVLSAVTTTRPDEIDWLYRGAGRIFPEAWDRFRAGVPEVTAPRPSAAALVTAYARRTESADPAVRERATADWCAWEDAVLSAEGQPPAYTSRPHRDRLGFVRICAHYFAHAAWLEDGSSSGTRDGSRASRGR